LLCDLSGEHSEIKSAIEDADWAVDHTSSCDTADAQLYDTPYEVAILIVHQQHLSQLTDIEKLLNNHALNWVTIVEPLVIEDEQFATVVSDHCYDYYTLPCDLQQLIATLGHAYGMSVLRPKAAIPALDADGETLMVGDSDAMHKLYATIKKSSRVGRRAARGL